MDDFKKSVKVLKCAKILNNVIKKTSMKTMEYTNVYNQII